MDIIQANLIENMVDENIGKHYKIIGLEKTCDSIKQSLASGEKRMDRMHGDIKDIKDSQFAMSGNVIAITKSINGNGIKGIAKIVEENAENISKLITKTVVNTKDIFRLDKISWIVGTSMVTGFVGLVIYVAKIKT